MDDHESCTALCMHLVPLNCRVKCDNSMFYIMWILQHNKSIKHIYKQKKKKATFKCHTHLDVWGTMRYNKSYYGRLYYPEWLQQDLLNPVSAYSVILTLNLSCGLGLYPFLLDLGGTLWPLGPTECGKGDTLWLLRLDQKNVMHFLPFALQGFSSGTQPSCPNWEGQHMERSTKDPWIWFWLTGWLRSQLTVSVNTQTRASKWSQPQAAESAQCWSVPSWGLWHWGLQTSCPRGALSGFLARSPRV